MDRRTTYALGSAGAAAVLTLWWAESRFPLRPGGPNGLKRLACNLALGSMSLAVAGLVERPLATRAARAAEAKRRGLVQQLPLAPLAKDALAFLGLDYTIYVWHVLTHRVPALWRLHLVHHTDLELSASTALRFHFVEMLVSVPYRLAQVRLFGVSPRALRIWQSFFFASVLFHHANLRLPLKLEKALALLLTSPRMHGIHHSMVASERDSNWTSGLSVWDRLHDTFRSDVAQETIRVGVPPFVDPDQLAIGSSLALPFTAGAGMG